MGFLQPYLRECIGYVCGGAGGAEALIAFHNTARKLGIRLTWVGGRCRCWGAAGVLSQPWGPRVGGCQELPCLALSTSAEEFRSL